MQLSIIGCPERKMFAPYVKRAARFYASELMTRRMCESIYVRIKFKASDDFGYASVADYSLSGKPRGFEIEINPDIGARDIFVTLAHEMAHVKQFVYSETNENLTRWKGTRIDPDKIDYWKHPWEIEAHGLETCLFTRFVIKEKLWEVFKDIKNPSDPIEIKPLGWKKEEQDDTRMVKCN